MIVFLESETFWSLLRDAAHWEFELFLMLLFDGLILGLAWPFLRKHWAHHIARDRQEQEDRWPWEMAEFRPHPTRTGKTTQFFKYEPEPLGEIAAVNDSTKQEPQTGVSPSPAVVPPCSGCGGLVEDLSPTIARCLGCGEVYDIETGITKSRGEQNENCR